MRHIAYSSIAEDLGQAEFAALVDAWRARNETFDVRGAIAFDGNMITQILEGPDDAVDELYRLIRRDRRHSGVVLTARTDIAQSQFSGFGMVRMSPSELYLMSSVILDRHGDGDTAPVPLDPS